MKGQCSKGQGVDCIRFVAAVLNELWGEERVVPQRLPNDSHLHNRKIALSAMLYMRRQLRATPVRDNVLEPADIVIVGRPGGGPGHGMVVGARPNELWHSTGRKGVQKTGIGALALIGHNIERIYRVRDKKGWLDACD